LALSLQHSIANQTHHSVLARSSSRGQSERVNVIIIHVYFMNDTTADLITCIGTHVSYADA